MNPFSSRSSLAAVATIAFGLTMPLSAAHANDRARQSADTGDQVAQSQPAAPASANTTSDDNAGSAPSAKTGNDPRARKQGMKHAPTAQMDNATPTDKTTTGKAASQKHPPTSAMDNAAPNEKSPGSRQ